MRGRTEKKRQFFSEHPLCYFCATGVATTEAHVPSRECFRDRVWPEGDVFPACQRCNNAAGKLEQVVALYMLLANHAEEEPARDQFLRLVKGVRNNNPELAPRVDLGGNAARRHFRDKGIRLAPGMTYAEVPIAELPAGNRAAFELFARRLTCALYYREVGRPLPLDHYIATGWLPFVDPGARDFAENVQGLFPEVRLTNRRNTNIGNQFFYLRGFHPEGTLFGHASQFLKSYFYFGAAVAPELDTGAENWKPHSDDIAALTALVG